MKLTTSELKNHLLLDHSSNPSVCAAYLLDEAQKMVNVTPRQCITKYAKATSKQEGHMDHHIRGSYHDVNLNRALTHWLSCANLPYITMCWMEVYLWTFTGVIRWILGTECLAGSTFSAIFLTLGMQQPRKFFLYFWCTQQCGLARTLGSPDMESGSSILFR